MNLNSATCNQYLAIDTVLLVDPDMHVQLIFVDPVSG